LVLSLGSVAVRSLVHQWLSPFFVDCSTLEPQQAFQLVFGRPMPLGVSDLHGAGCAQSGYVWLRFRATAAALRSLAGGRKPDTSSIDAGFAGLLIEPEPRQVHWEEALRVRRPDCYQIHVRPDRAIDSWLTMVVDRQRHLVYVNRFFL
jgi:hypothetical protein